MKYTLNKESVDLIKQALSIPGWTKDFKQVYQAGKLLAETLPEEFKGVEIEIELSVSQISLIKTAFVYTVEKQILPPSKLFSSIVDNLKLLD